MKHRYLFSFLFFLFCFNTHAAAQIGPNGAPCGQTWITPLTSVDGIIEDISTSVPPGGGNAGLHLKVKSLSGNKTIIHVFPQKCVENNPMAFNFKVGESLVALGSKFITHGGSKTNICASLIIRSSNGSLVVRDPLSGTMHYGLCRNTNCAAICQNTCKGMPSICLPICQETCKG